MSESSRRTRRALFPPSSRPGTTPTTPLPASRSAALCTVALVSASLMLGRVSGRAAEVFFFMVLALPWWALQAYDAYLGPSCRRLKLAADLPHRLAARPRYPFSRGLIADQRVERHVHHPQEFRLSPALLLHQIFRACRAFSRKRSPLSSIWPWDTASYAAPAGRSSSISIYAAYGFTNGMVNLACFGPGRIRNTLLAAIVLSTMYILWRRDVLLKPNH